MFELNYSKINSYLFCPYLYKFIYLDKKYTKHNPLTSLGISIHKTLKTYAELRPNLKDLLFYYAQNWFHIGYSTPQQMLEFYAMGENIIKSFFEFEKNSKNKILYTEQKFELPLDDKYVLKGTIDRVDISPDGKVEVIDYKIGFDKKNEEVLKNDLQLKIYAYAAEKVFNLKVDYISYYLMLPPKKLITEYSEDKKFKDYLIETAKNMENIRFDRKGNCALCLAKELCKYSDFNQNL